MMKQSLGVCYYPEHWSEELWNDDATRMKQVGIDFVRIGEFSWSRLEPSNRTTAPSGGTSPIDAEDRSTLVNLK